MQYPEIGEPTEPKEEKKFRWNYVIPMLIAIGIITFGYLIYDGKMKTEIMQNFTCPTVNLSCNYPTVTCEKQTCNCPTNVSYIPNVSVNIYQNST